MRRRLRGTFWCLAGIASAAMGGEPRACEPAPGILKMAQPAYPVIESRVTLPPVTVLLELAVSPSGKARDGRVLTNDAVSYREAFANAAMEAALHTTFERVPARCLNRMRIVFQVKESAS